MTTTAATARINAGQLDQRVILQQRATGENDLGEHVGTWLDVDTVWAKAQPLRSRELFAAGQLQNVTDVRFIVRWRSDVQSTWRVVWRKVPHDITGVPIDIDGQRVWLELLCATGVRDGR